MERSSEFYRGKCEYEDHHRAFLAEAEARDALQGSKEKMALSRIYELASRQLAEPAGAGDAVAMAKICTEVEAVHLPSDASVPTASDLAVADELDMLSAHIQEYIGPDDARDDIRRICRNRAEDLRRGVKRGPTAAEELGRARQAAIDLANTLAQQKIAAAEAIAAAKKALLQVGQWDAFTQRNKVLMKEALAAIAKWKEAQRA